MDDTTFAPTIERFTGFGSHYDGVRPAPPDVLAELLGAIAGGGELHRVVDLGCGTGLSTRYWARHAREVIGIEPADAMRAQADAMGGANITYRKAFSHATGLDDDSADLVTCSQSLHWMEPAGTFTEAARILRPGGVFAACDYDWPPVTGHLEADRAYRECMEYTQRLEQERGVSRDVPRWSKVGHLDRMEASGCFRFVRECLVHQWDEGGAERLVGLPLSQGHMQTLLKAGCSEEELGLDRLRAVAKAAFGDRTTKWLWSARVRIGVK